MSVASCPNTNLPEWKLIVNQLGSEREAYRAYMAHGNTIPFAVSLSDYKRAMGLTSGKYSVSQQIQINKRVRLFNQKYGTSHFVKYTPYGTGELSTAEVKFNYLPVSKTAQAERDRRRKMIRYVGIEDAESFESISEPVQRERPTVYGADKESDLGYFNDEGDFLPPSNFPDTATGRKLGPKFQVVSNSKKQDLKILNQELQRFKRRKKESTDVDKRITYSNTIRKIEENIEKVKAEILKIENLKRLDDITEYAEEDMKTLERIFAKTNPSSSDLQAAARIIKIWQNAADFSGEQPHIFYDPDEVYDKDDGLKSVTDKFIEWGRRADSYNSKLIHHQQRLIEESVQDTFGKDVKIDYNKPWKDVNGLLANVLDISEVDNVILQATHTWVRNANHAAFLELTDINKKIEELVKKSGLKNFDKFAQRFSNDDDRKTGDLVFRWSQTFFDWEREISSRRKNIIDNPLIPIDKKVDANRTYVEALRDKTIVFDARLLFYDPELYDYKDTKPTQKQIDDHIKMLKSNLGELGYQYYYDYHKRKVEEFKLERAAFISSVEGQFGEDMATIANEIAHYEMKNSPYYFAEVMEKGYNNVRKNGQYSSPSNRYLVPIPKRYINGKDSNFYDKNFESIESNKDELELYNYIFDLLQTLKNYLPNERVSFMHLNSLPFLQKKLYETISEGGVKAGFTSIKDSLVEAVRTDDLSTVSDDPNKKNIQIQHLQSIQPRVRMYVESKILEYKTENNDDPSADLVTEWTREITDRIVSEEKSFDLERVMKAFAATAVTYKHRSLIEDQIRNATSIIERATQIKQNAAGKPVFDKYGNQYATKGLKNLKEMYENFLDIAYWGYPSNNPEGQLEHTRVLTSTEKKTKEVIEQSIANAEKLHNEHIINDGEFAGRMHVYNDQLAALGGVRTMSKYGDLLLHYIQMKGMGWNAIAGFANVGFGLISNMVEASDGRNFSQKSFWKALGLTLNSVGRNLTFNTWDGLNGNGKKIRSLMNYFDTLKESKYEIYKPGRMSLFRRVGDKLEWANPYSIQSRTEYLNQAPIMISILMDTKIKVKQGEEEKEMSLWDAFTPEGTLKEGIQVNEKLLFETKGIIDKVIKFTHGNYDPNSPIMFKRKFIGRALSQFRIWAFEGFSERFRGNIRDRQLKNIQTGENFVDRRGRYGAYVKYFQKHNKLFGLEATFMLTYKLLGKLVGIKTNFDAEIDEKFDATDAANLRKNLTELVIYGMLFSMMLLLKSDIDDDDDKNKKERAAYFFMINQIGRLNTDIAFYTSPIAFERLTRNAIPAFSIVVDLQKLLVDSRNLILGGEDILQSGPNKGRSKTYRDIRRVVPGPAQLEKLRSFSGQIYNKQ